MTMQSIQSMSFLYLKVLFSVLLLVSKGEMVKSLELLDIAPGYEHMCAIFDNNKARCFGAGLSFGVANPEKLGDDPSEIGDNAPFIEFTTVETVTKLLAGGTTTCVLLDTGKLKCIGENDFGQAGIGITDTFVGASNGYIGDSLPTINLGTELEVLQVSLGYNHACTILAGKKVKCFGYGQDGELGYENSNSIGNSPNEMGDNLPFVNLGTNVEAETIWSSPAASHTCIILYAPPSASQRLKCWGFNSDGQLGFANGDTGNNVGDMGDNLPLLSFGAESRVASVSLGYYHTCAQLINFGIRCFGFNGNNQLALGNPTINSIGSTSNTIAVPLESGKSIKAVTCGDLQTCFLYDDQLTFKCMGKNEYGELGKGSKVDTPLNATLVNIAAVNFGTDSVKIKSILNSGKFSCALFESGEIKCFGANSSGQFGIGNANDIGDGPFEMGTNLTASVFYNATNAPSQSPTPPTSLPSKPSIPPTNSPITKVPTLSSISPTITQNKLTSLPTKSPIRSTTEQPTTGMQSKRPTRNPTTRFKEDGSNAYRCVISSYAELLIMIISSVIFFFE